MKHLFSMLRQTFAISMSTMLIYRGNIVFFLIFETLFLASMFLTVDAGFRLAGGHIGDFSISEAYALTAVNSLSHQIFLCFFITGLFNVATQVWNGQFDYILLKPLSPLISMWVNGQFVVSNLPNLLLNAGVAIWLLAKTHADDPRRWLAFGLLLILGVLVRIALALMCMAPAFLAERLAEGEDLFWSVTSLSRYPLRVFPRGVELVLTFVIPLGMMAAVPVGYWYGSVGLPWLFAAVAAAVVFCIAAVKVFLGAVSRYQSVNSGV